MVKSMLVLGVEWSTRAARRSVSRPSHHESLHGNINGHAVYAVLPGTAGKGDPECMKEGPPSTALPEPPTVTPRPAPHVS